MHTLESLEDCGIDTANVGCAFGLGRLTQPHEQFAHLRKLGLFGAQTASYPTQNCCSVYEALYKSVMWFALH